MEKYKVFLYKCNPLDISGDIATALWVLFVQLPFNLFSFILQLLVHVLKVLDLGTFLFGLQKTMMTTSKTVFEGLIGGKILSGVGKTSFVGLAIILMAGYLLYQFTNGKGRFLSSLFHFLGVFTLVFFYFGNVTGTGVGVPSETGGTFLFRTVQKVTTSAQEDISKALNPVLGSNDPTKVFTTYLKETANYINTGNVEGTLADGKIFDYSKASGEDGASYISDLEKDTPYLQANNEVLIQKFTFSFIQSLNAYIMVLPMAVVSILVSVLNLILLIFILLFPLTAALSFFPFFRNAAMNGVKKMMVLVAIPAGLSILLSILLYLLKQIDGPVNQAVLAANIPDIFRFLVTIVVEVFLKGALLYGLWRYRDGVLDFLTGAGIRENGFGNQVFQNIKEGTDITSIVGTQAMDKAQGTVLLGAGTAMMAGGGLLATGSNFVGNNALAESMYTNVFRKGSNFAYTGLEHFMPKEFKKKLDDWKDKKTYSEAENEDEQSTPDFTLDTEENEQSLKKELEEEDISDVDFEGFQSQEEEGSDSIVSMDEEKEESSLGSDSEIFVSYDDVENEEVIDEHLLDFETTFSQENQSQQWKSGIESDDTNEEWLDAFQDLQEEREEE